MLGHASAAMTLDVYAGLFGSRTRIVPVNGVFTMAREKTRIQGAEASLGWRVMPWTVTLAVTNLTDTDYWRSTSMPGAPRTALVSVNYVF